MRKLIGRLYYWLWHDVLRLPKPITDVTREDAKKNPFTYIVLALLLGIALVKFSKKHWWESLIWLGMGMVIGHIFW